jgi:peptidoglycan/LPS O-acetylase OafA/YrhL
MTEKDMQKWEAKRAKGRLRFVLENGVLAWGVPMFVFMTYFMNDNQDPSPGMLLTNAVVWAIGGALFGWIVWTIVERKYRKYKQAA